MSKLLPSPAASGGVGQPQLAPVQAGAQRRALLPAHAPLRGHRHHHRGPLLAAAPACASRNPTAGLEQGVADQHGGSQQQQRRQHQGLHSVSNITRIISRHRGALLAARSSPTASSLASIANDEPHESTPLGASADSPGDCHRSMRAQGTQHRSCDGTRTRHAMPLCPIPAAAAAPRPRRRAQGAVQHEAAQVALPHHRVPGAGRAGHRAHLQRCGPARAPFTRPRHPPPTGELLTRA